MPDEDIERTAAEETAPAAQPEENQEAQNDGTEPASSEPQDDKSSDQEPPKRDSRSQERIRETIAARKEAERLAEEKAREAAYWREQALAAKQRESDDELEGVTDEGIDPKVFAESLEKRLLSKVEKAQEKVLTQSEFNRELAEVSKDPLLKSPVVQRAVTRIINTEKVSPVEALEIYKEEQAELSGNREESDRARNQAGQFVRKETQTPPSGRGSGSGGTAFTRSQIDKMSLEEYQKNLPEIQRQLSAGLIK